MAERNARQTFEEFIEQENPHPDDLIKIYYESRDPEYRFFYTLDRARVSETVQAGSDAETLVRVQESGIRFEIQYRPTGPPELGFYSGCVPNHVYIFLKNHLEFDLSDVGIYPESSVRKSIVNYDYTCMYKALDAAIKASGAIVDEGKLVSNWNNINFGRKVRRLMLRRIAESLDIIIQLVRIDMNNSKNRTENYNSKTKLREDGTDKPIIRLVESRDHIMHNKSFNLDKFFPLGTIAKKCNFDDHKWHLVLEDSNYRQRSRQNMKSFFTLATLLRKLETYGLVKDLPNHIAANESISNKALIDRIFLDRRHIPKPKKTVIDKTGKVKIRGNCEITRPKHKETKDYSVWYFDTETTTDAEVLEAYLYAACYPEEGIDITCTDVKDFLRKICDYSNTDIIILYAHNAKFDSKFILPMLYSYSVSKDSYVKKGVLESEAGKLYSAGGVYFDSDNNPKEIQIRDTYHHLSDKLANLPRMVNLNISKQPDFPYEIYNTRNMSRLDEFGRIEISEIEVGQKFSETRFREEVFPKPKVLDDDYFKSREIVDTPDPIEFYLSRIPSEYFEDNKFLMMRYAQVYCIRDVRVLAECFEKYRELSIEAVGIDAIETLTASSLAQAYLNRRGAYEGVYNVSEDLREYINQAATGGRVQTKNNERQKGKEKLYCVDYVSLYPTAMEQIKGYPKGPPKYFEGEPPEDSDFYVATVVLKSVKNKYNYGIISRKRKETLHWYTDSSCVGETFILTEIAIKQAERYLGAKFEYIGGIFWNQGFNTTICDIVKELFTLRKQYKKQKNPIEKVYKLILNSLYGKTMEKPHHMKTKIERCKKEEAIKKFRYKQEPILMVCGEREEKPDEVQDWWIVYNTAINNHKNYVFCGAMILDKAREIVNEILIPTSEECLYTDTDSLYLTEKGLETIKRDFPEAIGKELGQLHCDYEHPAYPEVEDWVGVDWVFLNKKQYCIRVESESCPNKYFTKIRSKGITTSVVESKCRDLGKTPIELYKDIYDGDSVEFNNAEYRINFKFTRTGIETVEIARRTMRA